MTREESNLIYTWPGGSIPIPSVESGPAQRCYIPEFTLLPGKVVLIAGPSGCGKSFFLSVLAGLADSSKMRGDAKNELKAIRPVPNAVLVPQTPAIRTGTTLSDEVKATWQTYCEELGKLNNHEIDQKINKLSNIFGLDAKLTSQISTFSGGEKKRLGLLLRMPVPAKVFLLDEPDSGVDSTQFSKLFQKIIREDFYNENEVNFSSPCFLIVSHNVEEMKNIIPPGRLQIVRLEKENQENGRNIPRFSPASNHDSVSSDSRGSIPNFIRIRTSIRSFFNGFLQTLFNNLFGDVKDYFLLFLISILVFSLVCIGENASDAAASSRLAKHGYFSTIISFWIGLQLTFRYVIENWKSWREDVIWRQQLLGKRLSFVNVFRSMFRIFFDNALVLLVFTFVIVLFGTVCFCFIGRLENWVELKDETPGFWLLANVLSGTYGILVGYCFAAVLPFLSLRILKKEIPELFTSIIVPGIVLFHLIFSARFLIEKDGLFKELHDKGFYTMAMPEQIAFLLPTNYFATIFESNADLDFRCALIVPFLVFVSTLISFNYLLTTKDNRNT